MPGSGWGIAKTGTVSVGSAQDEQKWTVNRTILRKGDQTQVMLYWYQGRGRIMHNEYTERIYRVLDSILLGRTDGAFVRLISIRHSGGLQAATSDLIDAAEKLIPKLWDYVPDREAKS
jgi:EpsI family protein